MATDLKELAIGETFELSNFPGRKFKVVEDLKPTEVSCNECALIICDCYNIKRPRCADRSDKKTVHFVDITMQEIAIDLKALAEYYDTPEFVRNVLNKIIARVEEVK